MINPDLAHRVEGSHWVSPVNFVDEVRADLAFPSPLGLIDSTLRKVRYTAGAATTVDGFLRIAAALAEVGVRDESLNLDWWGADEPNPRELELVREVLAGDFAFTTNVYADTLLGDGTSTPLGVRAVDLLAELGARAIAPGIVPAPDAAAEARQRDQLAAVIAHAHQAGLGVTVTLAQCGRRDWDGMLRAANTAIDLGVTRLDLMDSTSSLSPEAMRVFIRRFRAGLRRDVPLTMHVHDDFGLGTAAAIAAASAGAGPDVSVNGASYRCGFPPLEEVVTSLEVLYGVDTGIAVDRLDWLCHLVAAEMGLPLPALKPISGGYAFLKHTPGDVLACLRDGVDAFPPISGCVAAPVVGAEVRWVWDTLNSPAMARQLATNLSLDVDPVGLDPAGLGAELDEALAALPGYPRWLEPAAVEEIARRYQGLVRFNALPADDARAIIAACSYDDHVLGAIVDGRPYRTSEELIHTAATTLEKLPDDDLIAALNRYAPLGVRDETAVRRLAQDRSWSSVEEAGVSAAPEAVHRALVATSAAYQERFGWLYVVSAFGKTGAEMLTDAALRLHADRESELATARAHVQGITALRLRRALVETGA